METSANGIYYADNTMGHPDLDNSNGSLVTLLDELLPLAGFSTVYTGTNKRVYQSNDVESNQLLCRIDDTNGGNARLRGFETMSDIDTGTGLFPLDTQYNGGFYIYKSNSASIRPWRFYSNGKIIYFFIDSTGAATWPGGFIFGDINSFTANDAYGTLISGSLGNNGTWNFALLNNASNAVLARAYTQIGASIYTARYSHTKTSYLGYTGGVQPFPRRADNKLSLWPIEVWDTTIDARGLLPGLWNPIHNGDIPEGFEFTAIPALFGRTLKTQNTGSTSRQCLMDLTGPW